MRATEKLWGWCFLSSQPASLVGKYERFTETFLSLSVFCFRNVQNVTFSIRIVCLFTQNHYPWIFYYLTGSTDFGNVSFLVPGIHPFFYIGTDALNHTEEYAKAAGRERFLEIKKAKICHHLPPSREGCWFLFIVIFSFSTSPSCVRSWGGPVAHPEGSQGPGNDSCGCDVLPRSLAASERGLQAGQTESRGQTRKSGTNINHQNLTKVRRSNLLSLIWRVLAKKHDAL